MRGTCPKIAKNDAGLYENAERYGGFDQVRVITASPVYPGRSGALRDRLRQHPDCIGWRFTCHILQACLIDSLHAAMTVLIMHLNFLGSIT